MTSNGVRLMLDWIEVLYDHLDNVMNSAQCDGLECTKEHKYYSNTKFNTSICPSNSGWYDVLMQCLVPQT